MATSSVLPVLLLVALVPLMARAGSLRAIVPVVGSTQGAFQSHFKTSLQIHNRSDVEMRGTIVIHPAGVAATESDPALPYVLAPHATLSFDDIVASVGIRGLGSLDFVVESGGVPAIVARAYDEKGEDLGTTGVSIRAVSPKHALRVGEQGSLIAPPDMQRYRFNIGVRTLADGARVRFIVRSADGAERVTAGEISWPPHYFVQRSAAEMLGGTVLEPSDSVSFEVVEGSLFLYGATTDNTTNDPSIQMGVSPQD